MIKTILFDLGQVLIELGEEGPIPAQCLPTDTQFTLREWFHSPIGVAFEKGEFPPDQFARILIDDLQLTMSPEYLLEHFTAWPKGWFVGAIPLLESLSKQYELAVLSNTNGLHYPRLIDEFGLEKYFEPGNIFASHLIGKAKPDPECFSYVLRQLNKQPEEVLFLDDSSDNIASARSMGMQAEQVTGHTLATVIRRLDLI